jgi:hypothetical protein
MEKRHKSTLRRTPKKADRKWYGKCSDSTSTIRLSRCSISSLKQMFVYKYELAMVERLTLFYDRNLRYHPSLTVNEEIGMRRANKCFA